MSDRLEELAAAVEEIRNRLGQLDRRVADLEEETGLRSTAEPWLAEAVTPAVEGVSAAGVVGLLGRTLVIFGGAYLIRAVTDMALLPGLAGSALGLAYAFLWLILAHRAGRSLSAHFHGATAVLIAFPLLWEATARFQFLTAEVAAGAVAVVASGAFAVAVHRRLRSLAWLTTLGSVATALGLIGPTRAPLPFVTLLVLLGVGTLWVAYGRDFRLLPWASAGAADLGILVVTVGVLSGRYELSFAAVLALLIAFFVLYVGSFAARTLVQGRQVGLFEVAQTALVVGPGYWGAIEVARRTAAGGWFLGTAGVILGLGAYGVAFAPAIRQERRRNFFFYTTLGLVLVLMGSPLILPGPATAVAWALLAVLAAFLSGRLSRVTLSLHSALYLLAAVAGSGLAAAAFQAFAAAPDHAWTPLTPWHGVVLAALIAGVVVPVARTSERWGKLAHLPPLLVLVLALGGLGGTLVALLTPLVAGEPGAGADAGALAALRTAVLAAAAVALAWAGRRERFREAAWLVYPVLVAAGLKLILEDFPHGRPLTLFPALALLGAALIAAARLSRRDG